MKHFLFVAIGGSLGSVTRYKLGGIILHGTADWRFPFSTFIINVLGCLIAGILAGLAEKHDFFSSDLRIFLFTGFLGGFTTFSAFGLETVSLLQRHETSMAATYVAMSLVFGIFALWMGLKAIP